MGLAADGVVGPATWNSIYRHFIAAEQELERMGGAQHAGSGAAAAAAMGTAGAVQYPGRPLEPQEAAGREAVQV